LTLRPYSYCRVEERKNNERNAEFYRYRRLSMIAGQGSRRKDHESHLPLAVEAALKKEKK
jgi:hypothetical protein